ncbi:hypothetical protein ACFX1T_037945 [Malus domestica]
MNLFTEKKVFSRFTTAYRLAIWPTSLSPFFVYATTDGVVLWPSALVTMVELWMMSFMIPSIHAVAADEVDWRAAKLKKHGGI